MCTHTEPLATHTEHTKSTQSAIGCCLGSIWGAVCSLCALRVFRGCCFPVCVVPVACTAPAAGPGGAPLSQWMCFKAIEHPHGILLGTLFPLNPRLVIICDASPVQDAAATPAAGKDSGGGHGLSYVGKKAIFGTLKMAKLLLRPQHILARFTHSRKSALHVIDGGRGKSIGAVKVWGVWGTDSGCSPDLHGGLPLPLTPLCYVSWPRQRVCACVRVYVCVHVCVCAGPAGGRSDGSVLE
jgi:hypothetical protein